MISLRDMNAAEFTQYRLIFIDEYAADLQSTRGYDRQKAVDKAIESIDLVLPHGVDTPANRLWCILHADDPEAVIGYLWLWLTPPSSWISDFYILPEWRNQGFGGAALNEMKRLLKGAGINEVGLRVAPENASAKALYEKNGFRVTGFNMSQNVD